MPDVFLPCLNKDDDDDDDDDDVKRKHRVPTPRGGGGGYFGQFLLGMCRWPLRAPTPL